MAKFGEATAAAVGRVFLLSLLLVGPALILSAVVFYDVEYEKDCTTGLLNKTEDATNATSQNGTDVTSDTKLVDTDVMDMTSPAQTYNHTTKANFNVLAITSLVTNIISTTEANSNPLDMMTSPTTSTIGTIETDMLEMTSAGANNTNITEDCDSKLTSK